MKTWHWLLIICAVGVILRVALPAHAVFANGEINFLGPDSYWQMGNALAVAETGNYGFNYDTLLAVFGQASIIIPVLLAVGVIIMVYFIGRRLFNSRAGLAAAAFIAVWPNEFMARTFLGAVDHHSIEVFITTGAALMFVLLITQKRYLSWWTLAGVAGIVALLLLYKNIWPVFRLPFFDQSAETMVTTVETLPLGSSQNYIPQVDFALAVIAGFILIRRGDCWQKWVVIVWVGVMLVATVYQVRFDYYLAVPLAVLVGFWLARLAKGEEVKSAHTSKN